MTSVQVEQNSYQMPPRDGFTVAHFLTVALSDADSHADSPLGTFGLCTGDYVRKPAFDTYRSLVQAHTRPR